MRNNKKGFTLVELLAVIVVLAIVMGIAAVAITNVLDSTRRNAFVASARSYIAGAKTLVNASEMDVLLGGDSTYAPVCGVSGKTVKYIPLSKIKTESGDDDKSPYGNAFVKATKVEETTTNGSTTLTISYEEDDVTKEGKASYVKVEAVGTGECTYKYSIYLTDGVYELESSTGTNEPVEENTLAGSLVAVTD